ncbi:RNA polymerase sigma factor [Novilysobacter spongiicola]|uniref:RNA polymerase sigma-70 factor, ECF subfamily n=1 Tax=Lysobacter spongiicola DSM 21749 TaxID=1122188 RepID=A0A1T4QNS6_9GAMM|nr:RNA polymerase sigma-70 factor, ECF subfamily [Lysobacter spongiicola DSM 21749]
MDNATSEPATIARRISAADSPQQRFAAMLEQHRGIVLRIAYGYCRHPEDRRDLVQDIGAQAWRAFPSFDDTRSRFSTWLYRVALNVAISQVRNAARHQRHHADLDDEAIAALPDPTGHGHDEGDAAIRQLYAVIDRLEPLDRALMLLYLDERSQREIAEILGISPSNVATRIHRLKQRLRGELA